MKNTIKNLIKTIIILLGLNIPNLFAQSNEVEILESEYNNSGQLFYIAPHPSWDKTPLDKLPEILSKTHGISSSFTFKLLSEDLEEKFTFTRVDQMIGNYPVVGGDMIFKRDKTGKLLSIIGIPRDPASIAIPVKTSEEALVIAEKSLNMSKKDYFMASAGDSLASKPIIELKYAPIGGILNNKVTLCYEIIIYTQTPIGQWYIYVNATSGHIEYSYNALPHANGTGNSLYSGNNKSINTHQGASEYFLFDTDRNIMTSTWLSTSDITKRRVITDATNTFDTVEQKPGVDVHWGMALVYDYFLNVHGRKSYDGKGTIIKNNVRYHMTDGPNAFFSNDPTWIGMYYSEGNNARWADVVSLDVVGHELSHAVVSRSARLIYQGESGALDESFADIFGHNIEMTGKASNWLMGEECFTPNSAGDNLRDLSNPNNSGDATGNGKCPDTYKGTYWKSTSNAFDDGGVHFNSGVQNYWYYLLTVGGNGTNDAPLNHQFAVTGIGQQKSEKIVYRNLTRYLGSSSDYKAARKGALLAAEDLYGKNSNEYQQVCNAWYAVGVGEKCCKGDDSLVFTFKVTDTKCHDSEDGEIELTVKNKKGDPITLCKYEWYKNDTNNVLLADTRNIINLDSGKYVVIVKDTVNHCESFDKTEVKSPEELKVSVSGGGTFVVPCQRSFTINLSASASGGTTPYTYNWPNAIKEVVLTGSGGSSRIYTATVTDKNGCPAEKSAIVTYIPIVCSYDPNEIVGPPSYSDNKWVSINATLPYKIRYENDPKFATGPAQKVTINHKLDSNTDLTSFKLSSFGFYKYSFDVPDNSSTYSKRLDLRDSFGIFLDVTAGLDIDNKEAFWIFESIDPATGLPPASGSKGYLAVNDTITHKGEGFVNYTIKAKSTAKTGDSIRAKAIIVFDDNPAVPTPRIFNLIDAKPPTSYIKSVASLIDSTIVPFTLRGKDDTGGSGLGNFDIYVSENGGAYNLFAKEIADTQINFRGNYGSTYTAYSIASDNVDNREGDKTSPDITFSIASNEFFKPITPGTSLCTGDTLNIRWLRSFVNSVNLQYSADSAKTFTTFATNLGGIDTLYRWRIPGNITGIKNYVLRALNASNSVIIDTSDYFELKQGPVISLGPDTSFCDGTSFSLTLNPGSGYSSYKWSDSATSTTKTVSNYGTYWVKVTASTGCKSTDQIVVSKDLLPVVSSKTLTSPLCFGNTNGAIDITVVSGTAPYTYLWNNSATTQDLTNIAAGNYSVAITDKKGCNIIEATTLTQPAILTKSHAITNVKCFGGSDGAVNETITGGTTPYSYSWSNASTTEDISSLIAATYYLEVTDKNNCMIRDTSIVTQPTKLAKSHTQVNVKCYGDATGSVDLTITGGTTAYSYAWTASGGGSVPSGQSTNQDLTGLIAGDYFVTVTDANNCIIKDTVKITQPSAPLASSKTQVDVKCYGNATGSIDLTVTGGTTAYTYAWTASGGGTVPSGQATNQDLTGLVIGTYNVTITDANNCTTTNSATITQPAAALASSKSQVNVLCYGNATGSIDLSVTGGTTGYTYAWTASGGGTVPSGQATNQDLTNLVAGTYNVTITDANNCTTTNSATITQPSAPLATSKTQVDVKCYGNATGSIDLSVTGGTTGYTYAWTASGGGVIPSGQSTNQDLTGLVAGTYNVTVTDANNCTTTNSATITQPSAPLASSKTQVDVKCYGDATGSIDLTVTGGTTAYTYAWTASGGGTVPSGQATNQDLTGLVIGTYNVTITDANNCTTTNSATITQPAAALASSKSQVNVLCYGNATGSIDLSVTGGTTGYTYAWTASGGGTVPSGQATNQDLTNLVAGTYNVTITDANNCTTTNSATITQPSAPLATSKTQVDVKCYGNATGSIDLSVTGGTTGYTYAWTASGGGVIPSGQSTNQDLTGLVAGTYNVTVTDANNCTTTNSATITQPSAPLASSKTQVDVKCYGNATGSIDLTVTGGTTAYTYAWTASGGGTVPSGQATNQDLTGLVIGTYNVTITDANNCTTTNSATITQPAAALASSKSQVNVLCYGNATGSIDLSVTGGTTGYTYAWTASGGGVIPSGQSTNQDLTGLVAGTYNVTITDANNCTTTNSATITQPSAPLATSKTQVDVKCYGNATGSIDLSVTGGTTGYTYAWTASGGGVIPSGQSTNQDLTGLVAGTYNVTVTDANNCTTTNSATITQPSAPLASSKTQVDVKCYGNATGSIDLTVTGGTTAYTYAWTASGGGTVPSGQATNQDLTGLVIGTYNVTITDANNCTTTNSATITQPTQLIISNIATDVKCFGGNDGGVNVTVSGGVTPYSYSWTNGATTEDITNVVIGNYTLTVTDNNGCTIQTTGIVNQPALLVASHVISDVKCYNGSDGAINVTIAGGITPYVFAWSSSDVTEDISGKPTGTYKVTVTDKNLCVVKDSGFISQPAAPLSSTMAMSPVNCYAGNDGSADLTVAGGTSPYTFAWSNGKTTEDISGLTLGTYYVTITDFNNCQLLDTVVVTQPAAPLATTMSSLNVKCFGGNDGSADLTVTGGTKPFNFVWSNAQSTEDISGLILGKYVVTITDINLCIIKDSVTITQPAAPLSSIISQTAVKCFGGTDGGVTLTVSGGTLNYSYLWSNGATTKDISNVITGKYKVTVTDGNSCILKDSIVVTQPVAPIAATHIVSNAKCKDVLNGNINLSVTGGTSPYTFAWSNGQTNEDAVNLRDGHYVVTITDANGCKLKDSADITEPDSLIISADGTTATPAVSNGFVFVNVKGGTLPYTYFWNGSASNNNDTLFRQPIGTYIIRVVDANGCEDTDTFNILEAPPTSMLRIGPNPSNGSLTVFDLEAFGLDLPIYFELIDVEGKIRMDFQIIGQDVYTFDLPDALYNNTYMLRIYNDRFEETRKIHLLR